MVCSSDSFVPLERCTFIAIGLCMDLHSYACPLCRYNIISLGAPGPPDPPGLGCYRGHPKGYLYIYGFPGGSPPRGRVFGSCWPRYVPASFIWITLPMVFSFVPLERCTFIGTGRSMDLQSYAYSEGSQCHYIIWPSLTVLIWHQNVFLINDSANGSV